MALLGLILWAVVTDYHFEMPESEHEPEPLSADEKAVFIWAIYFLVVIGLWLVFFIKYWDSLKNAYRQFRQRRREKVQP